MKIVLCATAFLLATTPVLAESTTPTPDPKKAQTIQSIVTVLDVEQLMKDSAEALTKNKSARSQKLLDKLVEEGRIKPEQRDRMIERMKDTEDAGAGKGAAFVKELEIPQFINSTYTTLLDRYFTEKELKDLLRFLNSPTGKKMRAVAPQMSSDSVDLAMDYFMPKILKQLSRSRGIRPGSKIETMPELRRYREEMQKLQQAPGDDQKSPDSGAAPNQSKDASGDTAGDSKDQDKPGP